MEQEEGTAHSLPYFCLGARAPKRGALSSIRSKKEALRSIRCSSPCAASSSGPCRPCRRPPRGCGDQVATGGTTAGGDGRTGGDNGKVVASPSLHLRWAATHWLSPAFSSSPSPLSPLERSLARRATTRSSRSLRERECSKDCASPTPPRRTTSR